MTGLYIVAAALALTLVVGLRRRATDGRPREIAADAGRTSLDQRRLGHELGTRATFVQFSSTACAPCRTTRTLLASVVAEEPDIAHVEIDAETRFDLVEEFGITRTPTVLVLDSAGTVRQKIVGAPRKPQVMDALSASTLVAA
ncbi:MAG TPA: thioredoxin family protein [Propionibacteriaceae bacterium]|nr:thioredoxin family protein [Propionibacteriaceae bacterium]